MCAVTEACEDWSEMLVSEFPLLKDMNHQDSTSPHPGPCGCGVGGVRHCSEADLLTKAHLNGLGVEHARGKVWSSAGQLHSTLWFHLRHHPTGGGKTVNFHSQGLTTNKEPSPQSQPLLHVEWAQQCPLSRCSRATKAQD